MQKNKISPKGYLISEEFKKDLYRRCGNVVLNYLRNTQELKGVFHKRRTEEEKKMGRESQKKLAFFKNHQIKQTTEQRKHEYLR